MNGPDSSTTGRVNWKGQALGTGGRSLPRLASPFGARDAAFCFYYEDNLELLRSAGADLCFFSPLAGESFPESTAGLYLGGGYPELHAADLASRPTFLTGVRCAAERGMPIYAECGGLMVLSQFIETTGGDRRPMAGILPFGTRMLKQRKALGYTEVMLRHPPFGKHRSTVTWS
jgi:cobyrinic acid a,c-diamide synthase